MISVIVPVYDVEPYLRQCIDSILAQTYSNLEILLIDDASPDHCGEICDGYAECDPRIRVFHNERNLGLSAARNVGLDHATGEYIGFVDSDDWIEPDMYEILLKGMENYQADVSTCGVWRNQRSKLFYNSGQIQTAVFSTIVYIGTTEIFKALLHGDIGVTVWNKLYRVALFSMIRFPAGHNFEDTACMHLILEQAHRIAVIPQREYHYQVRTNSIEKTYTESNLLDYADACLSRYYWFQNRYSSFFRENEFVLLFNCAKAIARVWRWWYGSEKKEKEKIENLKQFTQDNFTPDIAKLFPSYLRFSIHFMRHNNTMSFATLYIATRIYTKMEDLVNYTRE